MYAIIEDGGRQYKVKPGDRLYVDVRDVAMGQTTVEFDRVLAVGEGADLRVGRPLVEGAKVVARINREILGPKLHVVKFRRRKNYRRKVGHRQRHLMVTISEIVSA